MQAVRCGDPIGSEPLSRVPRASAGPGSLQEAAPFEREDDEPRGGRDTAKTAPAEVQALLGLAPFEAAQVPGLRLLGSSNSPPFEVVCHVRGTNRPERGDSPDRPGPPDGGLLHDEGRCSVGPDPDAVIVH